MVTPYSQSFSIEGSNFFKAGKASTEIRSILKELGIDSGSIRRAAIAAFEAEMNIVMYAKRGTMTLNIAPETIRIHVEDEGPGIENLELAMQEGYSTATPEMREMGFGAGMGLSNIKKNSDEFTISSLVGKGTKLEITITLN